MRPIRFPFDAVYWINLASRADRRSHMVDTVLKSSRLDTLHCLQRVEGIVGTSLNIETLYHQKVVSQHARDRFVNVPMSEKHYGMDLTPGALGCALSHMEVWRRIADSPTPLRCALILEDDVEFSPKFPYEIETRMASAPHGWGMLYLGGVDLLSAVSRRAPLWRQGGGARMRASVSSPRMCSTPNPPSAA